MENSRHNKGLEWCPEADLNHRHADFQSPLVDPETTSCNNISVKLATKDQYVSDVSSNLFEPFQPRVKQAALWVYLNRQLPPNDVVAAIRRRFALTLMEATEAAKAAHALLRAGAAQ